MTCFRESSYNKSNSKQDSLSRSRHRPWSEVRSWFQTGQWLSFLLAIVCSLFHFLHLSRQAGGTQDGVKEVDNEPAIKLAKTAPPRGTLEGRDAENLARRKKRRSSGLFLS